MATAISALPSRRRPPSGSAAEREPVPLVSLAVSAGAHALLLAGLLLGATLWKASQPKVYIVNLVPAIPAAGVPQAKPTPTPSPAPRPRPEQPRPRVSKPAPEPPAPPVRDRTPRDLPVREPVREARAEPLPPRPDPLPPRDMPTRELAPRELPPADRALPQRAAALPRPGTRELPSIPRPEPPRSAPLLARPSAPTTQPAAAAPREVVSQPARGLPTGSAAGSGTLALRTDGNFEFNWYFQDLLRRINEKWRPPGQSVEGQRVVVLFEIARSGEVIRTEVEETSGNFLYDQAAVRAVTEATPFRELPAEFTEKSIRIHMGFHFTTRG
jgi:TonB family protein